MKTTLKAIDDIEKTIDRLKRTYTNLNVSHAKQIRLMIGDFTPIVICDSIFPTKEFKKEYLRRIRYRIIELELQLSELKMKTEPEKIES